MDNKVNKPAHVKEETKVEAEAAEDESSFVVGEKILDSKIQKTAHLNEETKREAEAAEDESSFV